jgi:ASC-1-like (ASCH) protein
MPAIAKRKDDQIKVSQFITDTKGHKMAAVIDIEEFDRVKAVLKPIPFSEAWLYKNKKALESVHRGLKQAAHGRVTKLDLDKL